jgi:hypothetical protein
VQPTDSAPAQFSMQVPGKRAVRPRAVIGHRFLMAIGREAANQRSPESQRIYRHEIDEFVGWNCSEPRLSFNSTVVTARQIHLEDRYLWPGTTNVRRGTVRRLAHEATDSALQSQS